MKDWTPEMGEKYIDAFASTNSFKKLWNYFLEVSKSDYFQGRILELRAKCGIPSNGLPVIDGYYYGTPEGFEKFRDIVNAEIDLICKKYALHRLDWSDVMEIYIYYNKLEQPIWDGNRSSLCVLADLANEKEEPFAEETQEDDIKTYPLAIRISPYASQRDILDFVKKTYSVAIQPLQESYKDGKLKIGKFKNKSEDIQARNAFIYENKDKPLEEIRKLLAKKGFFLDDGHISKIVSLEKQRRKDV